MSFDSLLDTHKELLVIALTGRSVSKDRRKTDLDNTFKSLQHALCACFRSSKEGVDSVFNAFAGLQPESAWFASKWVR